MNSLTTKSLLACCAGVVSLLLSSSGVAQAEESSSDPRYSPATDPDWLQEDYLESLDMMGAARLINTYSGSGTAIVQFENITTQLDARFGSRQAPGDLVFGRCTHITAATAGHSDATGWAPGGNSCKIAWVMCFAGMKRTDFGGWPTLAQLERRQSKCSTADRDRAHATFAATALATVAPGAKIIALKIEQNSAYAFKRAVEWLLHPSSDTAWYLANEYTEEEAGYYAATFGGLSPAAFWNIVSTTASIALLGTQQGMTGEFSVACKATPNPDPNAFAPNEYLGDWLTQYHKEDWLRAASNWYGRPPQGVSVEEAYWAGNKFYLEYYEPYVAMLRDNEIMPFFPAGNALLVDTGADSSKKFVTPNGITYPACLAGAFAVSGAKPDYAQYVDNPGAYRRYIGTNSHPSMTDFVVAATGASSHDTPVAAAAVAVLRSSNLARKADVSTILSYLKQGANRSGLPEIPAGLTCNPARSSSSLPFPGGAPHFAHPSLDCPKEEYTLPVLHLGKSIQFAMQGKVP